METPDLIYPRSIQLYHSDDTISPFRHSVPAATVMAGPACPSLQRTNTVEEMHSKRPVHSLAVNGGGATDCVVAAGSGSFADVATVALEALGSLIEVLAPSGMLQDVSVAYIWALAVARLTNLRYR